MSNVEYVRADATTGEITFWGNCQPVDVPADAILGGGLPRSHFVQAGAIVAYTVAQQTAKAARPAFAANWSNQTMAWVDLRSLADHKADKWASVKSQRDASEFGGFAWSGSTFDSDPLSQGRIQAGVQVARDAVLALRLFPLPWTLVGGGTRTLSAADMIAVGGALGEAIIALHAIARAKKALIDAALTAGEVDAIS